MTSTSIGCKGQSFKLALPCLAYLAHERFCGQRQRRPAKCCSRAPALLFLPVFLFHFLFLFVSATRNRFTLRVVLDERSTSMPACPHTRRCVAVLSFIPFLSAAFCIHLFGHPQLAVRLQSPTEKSVPLVTQKVQPRCPRLLLVVVFNQLYYKNIPFLKQLYGRAFQQNIVYYGPKEDAQANVTECTGYSHGYLQQRCIVMAMKRFPDFDGYVWIGDDAIVNFHRLYQATDLDKIWTMRLDQGWDLGPRVKIFGALPKIAWNWGNPGIGMTQMRTAYGNMPAKYKKRMEPRFGYDASVVTAWSDAGYIPGKYKAVFIELAELLKSVTFECAIPTILRLMVDNPKEEIVEFEGVYLAQYEKVWPPFSPVLHPVKFSSATTRQKTLNWFHNATAYYKEEVTANRIRVSEGSIDCKSRLRLG